MEDKVKVIYCYQHANGVECKTRKPSSVFKIGKADQRVDHAQGDISREQFILDIAKRRIKEQQTAVTYGKLELVNVWDITDVEDSTETEHAIHKAIVTNGWERLTRTDLDGKDGSTEWFDFFNLDPETAAADVISFVTSVIKKETGKTGLNTYQGRGYQEHVKQQVLDKVVNGSKVIGCELAARFGKTLWALDLFKTLTEQSDKQYMILPAYVLTACSSFKKEVAAFEDFQDFVFVNYNDADFAEKIRANTDKKMVITASLHVDGSSDKYDCITELDDCKKVAFIDEADFGAHTESSREVLDKLNCDVKIIMTGTAIERALAGYDVDAIIKWSYFDMLLLKDGNHPMLETLSKSEQTKAINSCAPIVRPKLYKMHMPEAAIVQELLPDVLQTKWSKLLEDVDLNKFTLETVIKAMFVNDTSNIAELTALSLSTVTPADVSMIFGAFKNKQQHGKFVKLVDTALGDDFVVIKINGDETSNSKAEEKVKAKVANAKMKGQRVVIISKDMASRSFSIPEIDTVFLMYDGGLLSQTIQKSSRAFTPGKTFSGDVKTDGVIVSLSLDNNRLDVDPIDLYVVAEANRINDGVESLQESIRRICNSANIFQQDFETFSAIQVEADKYSEELLKQSSVVKDAIASISIESIDPSSFLDALLANRSSNTNKRNVEKVSVDTSKVRTAIVDGNDAEREGVTPDEERQFIQNVLFFTSNVDALKEIDMWETSNGVESVLSSLERKGEQGEVEDFYGLRFNAIKRLVETNAVPVRLLNTLLENTKAEVLTF